jgi:hypothetical protein
MNRRAFLQSIAAALGVAPIAAKSDILSQHSGPPVEAIIFDESTACVGWVNYQTGDSAYYLFPHAEAIHFSVQRNHDDTMVPKTWKEILIDGRTIRDDGQGNLYIEEPITTLSAHDMPPSSMRFQDGARRVSGCH